MILSWRRRRADRLAGKTKHLEADLGSELSIPNNFRCPISLDLMKDPVTLSTGITYDRASIEKWIESGSAMCPVTNQALTTFDQIPNHSIRSMIQDWCVENRFRGVERIPTPRIPVSPREVSEICRKIITTTQSGDQKKCMELIEKIKARAKESDRNKKCIVEAGAGCVLSASFESFATFSIQENQVLLRETLSVLTWMFPLGVEGQSNLGSPTSLRCMARFLHGEDLSTRKNAVLALKELLSLDYRHVKAFVEIEGVDEALVSIIKEQFCPTATKASLTIVNYMISESTSKREKITSRFVDMGLVSIVLEILVGTEKSISEMALGVLDGFCSFQKGLEMARKHALTLGVCVKKILRVSSVATELSISILWKICKNDEDVGAEHELVEALQLGAFHKLLVVLQVGCGHRTKEKATELLKLLNQYGNRLECFDSSMDFKYLKRP